MGLGLVSVAAAAEVEAAVCSGGLVVTGLPLGMVYALGLVFLGSGPGMMRERSKKVAKCRSGL